MLSIIKISKKKNSNSLSFEALNKLVNRKLYQIRGKLDQTKSKLTGESQTHINTLTMTNIFSTFELILHRF